MVEISKVSYKYIRGSVNTEVAVSSKCSENKSCHNIIGNNIDFLQYIGKGRLSTWCSHANGAYLHCTYFIVLF